MANLREIKKRITSVTSTKQITRTMEMVSTAKIRRALDRAYGAEPYKKALTDVMLTVAQDTEAAGDAPLLHKHDHEQNVLVVAIASDRGLAGGFNVLVERETDKIVSACARRGVACEIITCGRKVSDYFASRPNRIMHFEGTSAEPTLEQARMIASYICDGYAQGTIDRVEVVYHHARNRVDQELRVERLLPLDTEAVALARGPRRNESDAPERISSSFSFVPSAAHVLGGLVPSYVLTVIHQALIDSAASEQGARRKAMHSATENATAIVATLNRTYNRVRQASITTEINEIVGGASALEE
ncbi:ATP synthase F1 subunit gamma [Collinsella tanakaei]|uniref:ATP synthase F1 subunit gamma n=1 Tax=Collinsella tanakaei TaxID=626935 RepID=UPI0025A4208C|nr:ATP synthase F1 subunit gamma [Collinsella tanakaei]MDM8300969.1 ATP synthase F1 subunit gamma [Collinsella tanakaei]